MCLFDGVSRHFQQYFSYIVAVSCFGEGPEENNRSVALSHNVAHLALIEIRTQSISDDRH